VIQHRRRHRRRRRRRRHHHHDHHHHHHHQFKHYLCDSHHIMFNFGLKFLKRRRILYKVQY